MPLSDLDAAIEEVSSLWTAPLPAHVLTRTGHVVADTVAVAAAGARASQVEALASAEEDEGLLSRAAEPGRGTPPPSSPAPHAVRTPPTPRS